MARPSGEPSAMNGSPDLGAWRMRGGPSIALLCLAVACGSSGVGSVGDAGADASGGSAGSAGTGVGGSAASGTGGAAASGSGGTATGGTSGSGGGGSGGCAPEVPPGAAPVACGSATCTPDEICIRPCCGGPAPLCVPLPEGGACTPPDQPATCQDGQPGCLEGCTPPPAFCVRAADVVCLSCDNPLPRNCNGPDASCFGELDQDVRNVSCTCA